MTMRTLNSIYEGIAASDGDGVKLTRIIGTPMLRNLDPFLMLDAFATDEPQDYIGGFPPHPHRGFETVTYLIEGKMRHEDNAGHAGVIESGGVQWMTAGRGIIHSEMPEQENGLLMGFQLWLNLPSKDKMTAPTYQEFKPEEIAVETLPNGSQIKVIAGQTNNGTRGPVRNDYVQPTFLDVKILTGDNFEQSVSSDDTTFIYVLNGQLKWPDGRTLDAKQLGILSPGDVVQLSSNEVESRFIFVSAKPIKEPIAQAGPFVMNTQAELQQAFEDYRTGNF